MHFLYKSTTKCTLFYAFHFHIYTLKKKKKKRKKILGWLKKKSSLTNVTYYLSLVINPGIHFKQLFIFLLFFFFLLFFPFFPLAYSSDGRLSSQILSILGPTRDKFASPCVL